MRSTKLCLFLLLIAVVAAPLCLALSDDWTRSYADVPDYDFTNSNEDSRRKNNIPCRHRGRSYYDCKKRKKANPYRRGCIAITGCARFTD
ncbi:hypothetical protein Csa_004319 [Cucumis sativus]|nr:hypothetical protein Csa_004319 [Cucumis sativus]